MVRRTSGAVAIAALVVTGLAVAPAFAAWSASGSGPAGATATVMPTGATPVASGGTGTASVRWSAVTLGDGAPVGGYLITRINAVNGTTGVVGGTCAGVVTTTTCTDSGVPPGTYVYSDTPVLDNWSGPASAVSGQVTVN